MSLKDYTLQYVLQYHQLSHMTTTLAWCISRYNPNPSTVMPNEAWIVCDRVSKRHRVSNSNTEDAIKAQQKHKCPFFRILYFKDNLAKCKLVLQLVKRLNNVFMHACSMNHNIVHASMEQSLKHIRFTGGRLLNRYNNLGQ